MNCQNNMFLSEHRKRYFEYFLNSVFRDAIEKRAVKNNRLPLVSEKATNSFSGRSSSARSGKGLVFKYSSKSVGQTSRSDRPSFEAVWPGTLRGENSISQEIHQMLPNFNSVCLADLAQFLRVQKLVIILQNVPSSPATSRSI